MRRLRPARVTCSPAATEEGFEPANVFDGDPATSWKSGPGPRAGLRVTLEAAAAVRRVVLTFQGGFGSRLVSVAEPGGHREEHAVQDSNAAQTLDVALPEAAQVTLLFAEPTDQFGRVIVSSLELWSSTEGSSGSPSGSPSGSTEAAAGAQGGGESEQ